VERVREPEGVVLRSLRREDIAAVVEIETEAFSTPWKPETFAGLIDREAVELIVMEDADRRVIGYAVLWCILEQGELANLALATSRRGQGLGAMLLRHVMRTAKDRGVERLFLEVRASNQRAIDLYAGFGFTDVGLRRGYYESPPEDARVMLAHL
jgi:[ribosomal protein S18]-alanine N-acetyltransferase